MKFDIENERLRIHRHSSSDYSYEIPELEINSSHRYHTAGTALKEALLVIREQLTTTTEQANLQAELDDMETRRLEIMRRLEKLKHAPRPPVTDLLEQQDLCWRAIKLLDWTQEQSGHHVKMVGFYDMGDKDDDGDRDFTVSFTW